jgi:START domain
VFEGTTPAELMEFFNDDAHRMSWCAPSASRVASRDTLLTPHPRDPMLCGFEVLEADPRTGAEVARWVRRFPLMVSPRDYVFVRRSWADGPDLYTITRACTYAGCPPRAHCRRVEKFYSSWRMRAVPGRHGGVACEVSFLHYEEMGVQADLAKLAIRRGMWGCVQNMERGLCAFLKQRRERARARVSARRATAVKKTGLPRGGERETLRPNLLNVAVRFGLMALGCMSLGKKVIQVSQAAHSHQKQRRHKQHAGIKLPHAGTGHHSPLAHHRHGHSHGSHSSSEAGTSI